MLRLRRKTMVFLVLLVLAAGALLVTLHEFHLLGTVGSTCSDSVPCGENEYCGGDSLCHSGTAPNSGASCSDNSECIYGEICDGVCHAPCPSGQIWYGGECVTPTCSTGLVGEWNGNGNALDSSGNSNDGTWKDSEGNTVDGTYDDNGKFGKAMSFDGSSYVSGYYNLQLPSGNSDRTIGAWIKTGNATDAQNEFFFYGSGDLGVTDGVTMMVISGHLRFNIPWLGAFDGDSFIADEVWHHVAAVWNGSSLELFVDGSQETLTQLGSNFSSLSTATSGYIGIGGGSTDGASLFSGLVDDVRIYIPATVSHADAVRMAILAGWITMPQGSFHGADPITRAEMATILGRVASLQTH